MSLRNVIFSAIFFAGSGFCDDGVLLTCETSDGKQEIHIHVNEAEGYVRYELQDNVQEREKLNKQLEAYGFDAVSYVGTPVEMSISSNDESTISAEKKNTIFLLTKSSLTFAFSSFLVLEGPTGPLAWGSHTTGKCSKEPLAEAK